jgi:hypothetical protein
MKSERNSKKLAEAYDTTHAVLHNKDRQISPVCTASSCYPSQVIISNPTQILFPPDSLLAYLHEEKSNSKEQQE